MEIVAQNVNNHPSASKLQALKHLLCNLKGPLGQLNKRKYADIYAQQARARDTLTQAHVTLQRDPFNADLVQQENMARQNYVRITQSALSLIKQQSKVEWVGYGDECSRYFMAKFKQRKAMTSIYQLKDKQGQWVQGFDEVADIITNFYIDLLEKHDSQRYQVNPQALQYGHTLSLEQQIKLCQPFKDLEIKQVSSPFQTSNHQGHMVLTVDSTKLAGSTLALWYVKQSRNSSEKGKRQVFRVKLS